MTAVALIGRETTRIELGTAVVPLQSRHPIALGQQALSVQAACDGRFRLGVGPSHHWIVDDMLGLPYEQPAQLVEDYLDVFDAMFSGPDPVDVENDRFRVHNPLDVTDLPVPVLLAALGPVMLRIAGERADGTVLWMADEKAIGDHIAPRINKAAAEAGRPEPRIVAGIPVCVCGKSENDAA
jgi:F420-dependent oxidoreductase-like protein